MWIIVERKEKKNNSCKVSKRNLKPIEKKRQLKY